MFFSYLERCWKYGTFLRQIATASLQKAFKNIDKSTRYTRCSAGCWDLCSSFENINVTCAMVGRNTTNHSLEEENAPSFKVFGGKVTFFPVFWL